MNQENTDKLIQVAGPIFPQGQIDPRENLMCFGFETGDGWFELLQDCFRGLRKIREVGIAPNLMLVQVKEILGTLRVYVNGYDEDGIVYAVIRNAEARSGWTCDVCGRYGTTGGNGWLSTRCKEHGDNDEE